VKGGLPEMFTNTLAGSRRARAIPSWAALLGRFYEQTGLSLPALRELKAAEVPQPYRALLVHSSDMTPTLTQFYGQALRLRVLSRERQDDLYKREVILRLAEDARPVEYGVIRIHLDRLPPAARRLVLQEQRPLGDILQGEAIPHLSWPQAFFRLKSDAHAGAALGLRHPGFLYGRRNVLLDGSRRLLAEVIEVLAPASKVRVGAAGRELESRKDERPRKPKYLLRPRLAGTLVLPDPGQMTGIHA
jgi:chorismate-pyruvate lyase